MGLSLYCKKIKNYYSIGYTGFLLLRKKVAYLCSHAFGEHYAIIHNAPCEKMERESFYENFDRKTEQLLQDKKVSKKVVDFCLQSDCGGSIRYGACKEIYQAIKDYDDTVRYGYSGQPDCFMFSDFKKLLLDCIENKCDLIWD